MYTNGPRQRGGYIQLSISLSYYRRSNWYLVDQEEHAEAMSTEHIRTGKVYRRHITKALPGVRPGVVRNKSWK